MLHNRSPKLALGLCALFAILVLTGCGGSSRTHDQLVVPVKVACPPSSATMGCATQPQPLTGLTAGRAPAGPKFPDVSSYQGHPDWAAALRWGIWGAVAKLGEYQLDPDVSYNVGQFRALHMRWSVYWFLRPQGCTTEGNAIVSGLRAIGGPSTTGPVVVYDDEVPGLSNYIPCVDKIVYQAFHRHGVIYTAPGTYAGGSAAALNLWVAAYGPSSPPACPWGCHVLAWQYTDGTFGVPTDIPGIGNGDVSVSYSLFAQPRPPKPPKPKVVCFGKGWQHTSTCLHVRQQAVLLGRQRTQEQAYLKVSQANIATLQKKLTAVQGHSAIETRKAAVLNAELVKLLTKFGYHAPHKH